MNIIGRIQTSGLLSFGQFFTKKKYNSKKGKINDGVFGFLHISLVTCNKNKTGIIR